MYNSIHMSDAEFMHEALRHAARGRGAVEPNPMVGAVIVRDGRVVGRGWHQKFGGPHAEIIALADAGDMAQGATLYVTLEPCCHHGKTPPCTKAIINAGIAKVVVAMVDPFEKVAGKGIVQLRTAGIHVAVGICESELLALNRPYLTLLRRGRPYVHAKWAMTLDGKIATATGESQWISGDESRQRVHELRGRMDAIITGAGTVRRDDPLLTARPPGPRMPTRIVLSRRAELPADCKLLQTVADAPLILATTSAGSLPGVEILPIAPDVHGFPSPSALLLELGRRGFTNILIEAGPTLTGAFLDCRLVDEVHVFVAPKILGGAGAPSPVAGVGIGKIADALTLSIREWHSVGADVYFHGCI